MKCQRWVRLILRAIYCLPPNATEDWMCLECGQNCLSNVLNNFLKALIQNVNLAQTIGIELQWLSPFCPLALFLPIEEKREELYTLPLICRHHDHTVISASLHLCGMEFQGSNRLGLWHHADSWEFAVCYLGTCWETADDLNGLWDTWILLKPAPYLPFLQIRRNGKPVC